MQQSRKTGFPSALKSKYLRFGRDRISDLFFSTNQLTQSAYVERMMLLYDWIEITMGESQSRWSVSGLMLCISYYGIYSTLPT